MARIGENIYRCDWCMHVFEKNVNKSMGNGKKSRATAQLVCPKCVRYVTQH